MKNNLFRLINNSLIIIFIIFTFITLVGCSERKNDIVYLKNDNCIINNKQNTYAFQFASKDKIDSCELINVKSNNDLKFTYEIIEEKNAENELLKYNNYFIYGIIFKFNIAKSMKFESFEMKINGKNIEKICLNMNIIYTESNSSSEIKPLSVPMIKDDINNLCWEFVCIENLTIVSIDLFSELNFDCNIYINSIEQNNNIEMKSKEKFYVNLLNVEKYNHRCTNKVYLKIEYITNGIQKEYISDFTIIGNSLTLLYDELED